MSTPFDPNDPMTAQQARANAKGAKAQAKALRPWYRKKRSWLGLIILAIILIIVITQCSGGSDPGSTSAVPASDAPAKGATTKAPTTKVPDAPGIGTPVKAGDWTFTVIKIKCGVKKVGDQYSNKKAQGQFCLMNLNVKNNGSEAGTLMASNQKILDKDGRTFSSDDEASIYADADNNLFEEINPGNTLKGLIVFDIPKDAKPVQASLAGGLFGIKDVATVDLT